MPSSSSATAFSVSASSSSSPLPLPPSPPDFHHIVFAPVITILGFGLAPWRDKVLVRFLLLWEFHLHERSWRWR
ncbi:uncharacterized protein PHACADRAFT_255092 [Phanerochaete carnosa HHB-10118-sp]|uniref:Uncharacterized protein n=1 Tax=Phanerochaete carnosa (strain HHB-10118-sp) TaxID=650164 RepID=K5WDN4_PHACS|nr:uncharacterized protein PHACADRAFT_255092 [Phanerochaete carnosa HHB-10118-sp]EKM57370.1 hypothetical protein PHACADRAFT_255092 [Phanerochaete carnosa HHB-10118-sp]